MVRHAPMVRRTSAQSHLFEEVDEQVRRGRAAINHEQIRALGSDEHLVDFAPVF
jgi:hypothetical protein